MWFFGKKRQAAEVLREEEIQSIRQETLDAAKKATKSTDKLIKLLEKEDLGVTGNIFLATGGDRRGQKRG